MNRTDQSGSVPGYIIIGGILALLLIGGVFLVRKQLPQTTPDVSSGPVLPEEKVAVNSQDEKAKAENQKEQPQPQNEQEESVKAEPTKGASELPQTGPAPAVLLSAVAIMSFSLVSYVQSRRLAMRL